MLHCDICTKTNNHCCKADIPLDIPIALALIEVSGNTNLAITETPKFPGSVVIVDKRWFSDTNIPVDNHGNKVSYEYILSKNPDYLFILDRSKLIDSKITAKETLDNNLIKSTKAYKNLNCQIKSEFI